MQDTTGGIYCYQIDTGFNLVIEMLFNASRTFKEQSFASRTCFNLVIEMLFNASKLEELHAADSKLLFQSRNRDAFQCKSEKPKFNRR